MIQRCNNCQALFSDLQNEIPGLCEVCATEPTMRWAEDPGDSTIFYGSYCYYRFPSDGKPLVVVHYAAENVYRLWYADRSAELTGGSVLDSLGSALAWLRFLGYRFAGPYQIH